MKQEEKSMDQQWISQGRPLRIGTRRSELALRQTELAVEAIRRIAPGMKVELIPMTTRGDQIQDRALLGEGGKGAFIAEFEQALQEGRIDVAVHSAKDLPNALGEGLALAAVLPRGDVRDVLLTRKGWTLYAGAVIGTGSLRRSLQIQERYSVQCRLLRGNVNTRIRRLREGDYQGILLAAAGLQRMGLEQEPDLEYEYLDPEQFLPAACQGIIVLETRREDSGIPVYRQLNDRQTWLQLQAERWILARLQAGCNEAYGVYTRLEGEWMSLRLMREVEGHPVCRESAGSAAQWKQLADALCRA